MTADQPVAPDVDAHVYAAVDGVMPGAIVTRYLLVAEVIDPEDGGKGVVTVRDDDAAPWDDYALARMAIAKADAAIARQDAPDADT